MAISYWTIQGTHPGPRGLILAGVHGDEYEPIAAIRQLYSQIDPLQLRGEVVLIPIVNVPAFSRLSRSGPDGLDLARTFPGNTAGSVTEQIAAEVSQFIRDADFLIDLHTGGRAIRISPLTGYMLHENENVLKTQQRMARAFNLPILWGTTPNLEGRSLSVARDANVPAIYAEWGGGGGCEAAGVADYVQGCLNLLAMFEMLSGRSTKTGSRVKYVVEDARENSGHLQLNYPAPAAGFFEPVSALGNFVEQGTLLGTIWQKLDEPGVEVRAEQSGLLFLLRAVPAVQPGDCLATILQMDRQTWEQGTEGRV